MNNRFVVIMAGGKGERFWPQSRLKKPKHLLPIVGEKAMLAQTLDRLEGVVPAENIFVVTNEEQREAVLSVCENLPCENIVGEPEGRDTAAAVGLSALLVKSKCAEGVFAMLPADHVIEDVAGFQKTLENGFALAMASDCLVTVGIEPTYAATGYGYIQKGAALAGDVPGYDVSRFVEKPDAATAQSYIDSGEYFWNAGMFVWTVASLQKAFAALTPNLHEALTQMEMGHAAGKSWPQLMAQEYGRLEKISIDYAIMEKADNVVCTASLFDWDDVGEWPAIARHYPEDEAGNVVKGEALLQASSGNIVVSEGGHLTAVIGLDDVIVVQTADATLVCAKDKAQDIKALVKSLQEHRQDLL